MENTQAGPEVSSGLERALNEAGAAAREQLTAAWQLQIERVEEQLNAGWRDEIGRVFEERFAELSGRLAGECEQAVSERAAVEVQRLSQEERASALEELNLAIRRIGLSQSPSEWAAALLDAASAYSRRTILFGVGLQRMTVEGLRGFDEQAAEWQGREVMLAGAPALAAAVDSGEPVVALRSAGELSPELETLAGGYAEQRVHLYPVTARGRCAAVLFAEISGAGGAQAAIETLVAVAGLSLASRSVPAAGTALVPLSTGAGMPGSDWTALPQSDQERHLRAQRFARVQTAEMRLYHSQAVRNGRARRDLYEALKPQIDNARETYHRQFVAACPSMVDYLHQELLRTLANGDAAQMGPEYPGPLA